MYLEWEQQRLELASKMGLPEGWAAREYKYASQTTHRIYSPDRKLCFQSKTAAFAHLGVEVPLLWEQQLKKSQLAKERQEWWQQRQKERLEREEKEREPPRDGRRRGS